MLRARENQHLQMSLWLMLLILGCASSVVNGADSIDQFGFNPAFLTAIPTSRGLGLAGSAPLATDIVLPAHASTTLMTFDQPVAVPLGAYGLNLVPTWWYQIGFTVTVEARPQRTKSPVSQCALVLKVSDQDAAPETGLHVMPAVEKDFPIVGVGSVSADISYAFDNIPAGDGLSITVQLLNLGNYSLVAKKNGVGGNIASFLTVTAGNN